MQFDSKFQPELITSTDETRPHLLYVELDVTGKRMMATDGHRGVFVPCEPEEGDHSGAVSREALVAARKAVKNRQARSVGQKPAVKANGSLAIDASLDGKVPSMTFARFDRDGYPFPPLDKVTPAGMVDGAPETHTFAVNARYLYELALAMGTPEGVHITVSTTDHYAPIMVRPSTPNGAYGVVMPMRK
jgi:DNA polymerase III sliding clamp (beta) subunit (PCNA family)